MDSLISSVISVARIYVQECELEYGRMGLVVKAVESSDPANLSNNFWFTLRVGIA